MVDERFFDERTAASAIKAKIVSDYFWVWAQIIIKKAKQKTIGYVDLFAGPGVYGDGQKSTPILILEKAIRTSDIRDKLHVFLNDKDKESADALRKAVDGLPGIETLKNRPEVHTGEVSEKAVEWLE